MITGKEAWKHTLDAKTKQTEAMHKLAEEEIQPTILEAASQGLSTVDFEFTSAATSTDIQVIMNYLHSLNFKAEHRKHDLGGYIITISWAEKK